MCMVDFINKVPTNIMFYIGFLMLCAIRYVASVYLIIKPSFA